MLLFALYVSYFWKAQQGNGLLKYELLQIMRTLGALYVYYV